MEFSLLPALFTQDPYEFIMRVFLCEKLHKFRCSVELSRRGALLSAPNGCVYKIVYNVHAHKYLLVYGCILKIVCRHTKGEVHVYVRCDCCVLNGCRAKTTPSTLRVSLHGCKWSGRQLACDIKSGSHSWIFFSFVSGVCDVLLYFFPNHLRVFVPYSNTCPVIHTVCIL